MGSNAKTRAIFFLPAATPGGGLTRAIDRALTRLAASLRSISRLMQSRLLLIVDAVRINMLNEAANAQPYEWWCTAAMKVVCVNTFY